MPTLVELFRQGVSFLISNLFKFSPLSFKLLSVLLVLLSALGFCAPLTTAGDRGDCDFPRTRNGLALRFLYSGTRDEHSMFYYRTDILQVSPKITQQLARQPSKIYKKSLHHLQESCKISVIGKNHARFCKLTDGVPLEIHGKDK